MLVRCEQLSALFPIMAGEKRVAMAFAPAAARPRLKRERTAAEVAVKEESAVLEKEHHAHNEKPKQAEKNIVELRPVDPATLEDVAPESYALRPVQGYGAALLGLSAAELAAEEAATPAPRAAFTGGLRYAPPLAADAHASLFEGIDLPALGAAEAARQAAVRVVAGEHAGLAGRAVAEDDECVDVVLDISGAHVRLPLDQVVWASASSCESFQNGVAGHDGPAGPQSAPTHADLPPGCAVRVMRRGRHYWHEGVVLPHGGALRVRLFEAGGGVHASASRRVPGAVVTLSLGDVRPLDPAAGSPAVLLVAAEDHPAGTVCDALSLDAATAHVQMPTGDVLSLPASALALYCEPQ